MVAITFAKCFPPSIQEFPRASSYKDFRFRLEVIDRALSAYAVIRVSDFGSDNRTGSVNITYDTVKYTASKVTLAPSNVVFGKHRVGAKSTHTATITNSESTSIMLQNIRMLYGTHFKLLGVLDPVTLSPGGTLSVSIEYDASRDSTLIPVGRDNACVTVSHPTKGFC